MNIWVYKTNLQAAVLRVIPFRKSIAVAPHRLPPCPFIWPWGTASSTKGRDKSRQSHHSPDMAVAILPTAKWPRRSDDNRADLSTVAIETSAIFEFAYVRIQSEKLDFHCCRQSGEWSLLKKIVVVFKCSHNWFCCNSNWGQFLRYRSNTGNFKFHKDTS